MGTEGLPPVHLFATTELTLAPVGYLGYRLAGGGEKLDISVLITFEISSDQQEASDSVISNQDSAFC